MRIGFVAPRYGKEIVGGAEYAVRMFAERLVEAGQEVEVFTSCAIDHRTWQPILDAGTANENGVVVNRFNNSQRAKEFDALSYATIEAMRKGSADDEGWIKAQGPVSNDLVDGVASSDCDVIVGYPYLYWPIVEALKATARPTVLHPAAHDEWFLRLPAFRELFESVDGLVYQTQAERELVESIASVSSKHALQLGLGVESRGIDKTVAAEKFELDDRPYFLALGRVDDGKGSRGLADWFEQCCTNGLDAQLLFAGPVIDSPTNSKNVRVLGPVSDDEKWSLLAGCNALISASPWEAFGLVLAEAWSVGKPVIANRNCAASRELTSQSKAGTLFDGFAEFASAVTVLSDGNQAAALGSNGPGFVESNLTWPTLLERYLAFLTKCTQFS